jgi:cytochrome c553
MWNVRPPEAQALSFPSKRPRRTKEVRMPLRKTASAGLLLLFALGLVCAAQDVTIKKVPIKHVPAFSGESMYNNYCAVCHGKTGKGGGPAVKALTTLPPDLTLLAAHNNGTFPGTHVYTVIRGDANMPAAHGEKDMPAWGGLFLESCGANPPEAEIHQRISNLTKYVETLQKQ